MCSYAFYQAHMYYDIYGISAEFDLIGVESEHSP